MRRLVIIGLALAVMALAAQVAHAGGSVLIFTKTDSIYSRIQYPGIFIAGHHSRDSVRIDCRNCSRYWVEIVQLSNPNRQGGADTTARFAIQMRGRDPIYPDNDTLAIGYGARKTLFAAGADANPPLDTLTVLAPYVGGTDSTLAWNEVGVYAPYVPAAGPGFTSSRMVRVDFESAPTAFPWRTKIPEISWRILARYIAGQQPTICWYRINIYGYAE